MKCETFDKEVQLSAVATLRQGGTLLYPTDTIWGIGCDATNAAAVEKIYAIKQRDHSKSMLILCEDISMVHRFVGRVGEKAMQLLLSQDRPTTVILPMTEGLLAANLVAADGTIGVRIPQMVFCHEMLRLFGCPIVSTSANLSGNPSPRCYAEIDASLRTRVDYCVPATEERSSGSSGSRIVKVLDSGRVLVLRP